MIYDRTSRMPWGAHKGNQIRFIPSDYLKWIIDNVEDNDELIRACEEEINKREYEKNHLKG